MQCWRQILVSPDDRQLDLGRADDGSEAQPGPAKIAHRRGHDRDAEAGCHHADDVQLRSLLHDVWCEAGGVAQAHQLIEEALSKVQPLIEQKKARIEIKMDDPAKVQADKAHLELAIVNLLENALKYSADPHIVVQAGQDENDFYISVKDNGVGIEKQYLKNIFKKFYRIPTGDIHNVKGFGLGLNFVKRIIDAHKGKIRVNSLPGIGTEFRLFIPLNN